MIFEFELTDDQIEKINDIEHEVNNSGERSFVICCQLYLPNPDQPSIERPKIKGKAYYNDEAQLLQQTIRVLQ